MSILEDGPPNGEGDFPRLDRLEGILEGIDLEERLLFVNGEVFEPADEVRIVDRENRPIDVFALLNWPVHCPRLKSISMQMDELFHCAC